MRKLTVFNQVWVDAYCRTSDGESGWLHEREGDDAEFKEFIAANSAGGGALLFGRTTYEMMASYWPSPMAAKQAPAVAKGMNSLPKFVFSRTLTEVSGGKQKIWKGELGAEARRLNNERGARMAVL